MILLSVLVALMLWISTKKFGGTEIRDRQSTITHEKFHRRYNTSDKMGYILYDIGNQSSLNDQDVVDYIGSQISQPSPTRSLQLARLHRKDASQMGQSTFVDKLLSGRRNGFFVECGAADGETYSNSLFFELQRNWTGLLIEANPAYHRALLNKNRRAYVLNSCLSTERIPTTVRFRSSGVLSGIVGKTHGRERGVDVTVKCFPLNSIMEALGVSHVDYLSLDVEGPELEIIRTVDFRRLHIDVITVEYFIMRRKNATLKKLHDLRRFFNDTGIYHEIGLLPTGDESKGLDVVFSRV